MPHSAAALRGGDDQQAGEAIEDESEQKQDQAEFDQGLQVNNCDDLILRSKLTFSRKMERRARGMMTMNKK